MNDYLLRSMMFVPAHNEKFIKKSIDSDADALIFDFEDSVPEFSKQDARELLYEFLCAEKLKNKLVFVRLNSIESGLLEEDLKYIIHPDVNGVMLSKIYSADDIVYFDDKFKQLEKDNNIEENHFKFTPLIETTQSIVDINNICRASGRMIAVCFGGEDFLDDLHGVHREPPKAFDYPRAALAIAARAAGIQAIDTPYLAVHDDNGFMREESQSYELGFSGVLVLSPRQIEWAHRCFSPEKSEVIRSKEIVAEINRTKERGEGVAMLNGKMIGPPMRKKAEKVLAMMDLIEKKNMKG